MTSSFVMSRAHTQNKAPSRTPKIAKPMPASKQCLVKQVQQSQDTSKDDGPHANDGFTSSVALASAVKHKQAHLTSMPHMVELASTHRMPCRWRDTPRNQRKWSRVQRNEQFLGRQQMRRTVLVCHYCGRKPLKIISWDESSRMSHYARLASNQATADHMVPRSQGGDDSDSNMVVACYRCNYE